jgi:hypothetical protein
VSAPTASISRHESFAFCDIFKLALSAHEYGWTAAAAPACSTSEAAAGIVDDRRGCRDYADRIGQSSSLRVAKHFVLITTYFSAVSLGGDTEFDEAADRSPLSGQRKGRSRRDVDETKQRGGPNRSPRFINLGLCRSGEQRSARQVCHFFPRPFFADLSIAIGAAEANVLSRLTIVVSLFSGFTLPFTG